MGAFFVSSGLQQSAAFLSEEAVPEARPLLDLTFDGEIHTGKACRPYRIVRLEELIEQGDEAALEADLTLLAERLQGAVGQYEARADDAALLELYRAAADAVNRMLAGDLTTGFCDLEDAERAIQERVAV
ncbi:MAG: hypothetical protein ACYCW6_06290 [Candidatus Xenobia bacterium]